MDQIKNHLTGDFIFKLNITKHWVAVEVPLVELEIHYDSIIDVAKDSLGYFTEICDDRCAYLRFQLFEDARKFEERYMGVS